MKTEKVTNEQLQLEMDNMNPLITVGLQTENVELDEEGRARLELRKSLELELIKGFDKPTLERRECWFLMDSAWLNKWASFTRDASDTSLPGPISSAALLDKDNKPLPGLRARIDYRGVLPIVYFIFVRLYGKDKSPELPRYSVDIYSPQVEISFLAKAQALAGV